MSLTATQTSTIEFTGPRKRTSSFCFSLQLSSNPRPAKAPRLTKSMGATLRRTETYLDFSEATTTTPRRRSTSMGSLKTMAASEHASPIHSRREQKDKERRKAAVNHAKEPLSIRLAPQTSPPRPKSTAIRPFIPQPAKAVIPSSPASPVTHHSSAPSSSFQRTTPLTIPTIKSPTPVTPSATLPTPSRRTSPLCPAQEPRSCRPSFPRSKPEPDLYKKALRTCMKSSPEGQKILRMGPRLAISIMTATRELERIVAAQEQRDADDAMAVDSTPVLSKSWVVIPDQDWEMVDCSA